MKRSSERITAAGLLVALAACGTTARTGVPGGAPPAPEVRADRGQRGYTAADARFMQHMIAHHAQALEMTALVPDRSGRDDVRMLAERIEVSQRDEIAAMQRWLRSRGEEVPPVDAHHGHHAAGGDHARMPGMLTAEELARLAAASGPEFDRLFLELMIRHHEGALAMVRELFASEGAGQEPQIFQFASEVDADQQMEIARMRAMLESLSSAAGQR